MKQLPSTPLFYAALIAFLFLSTSVGKGPINGNGKVVKKQLALESFHAVSVETYFNTDISCGKMPMAEITIDENLMEHLIIEVKDGVLSIDVDEWIEATQSQIKLQMPFLTEFSQSGWGKVNISHMKSANFKLKTRTGTIKVQGKALKTSVWSGSGSIDLSELETQVMEVDKNGNGALRIQVSDTLKIKGDAGEVVYQGNPTIIHQNEGVEALSADEASKNKETIVYVNFKVKNNTNSKKDFIIKGPRGASFGYGFPMQPRTTRSKRVPVGTKIWLQHPNGIRGKLLLEVSADDEGKTINLF